MKKTLSITIAGVVFNIEEDGYARLRQYLDAVSHYFASYEGSHDIIQDIEARVAERFLITLRRDSREVITDLDVDDLIRVMGNVTDFAAIEEEEDLARRPQGAAQGFAAGTATAGSSSYAASYAAGPATGLPGTRRIYRDTRRKLLGGVAAGLAHHLGVDPLWVRLLFLMLFLGMPIFGGLSGLGGFFGTLSGLTLLVYVACWVSFPANDHLEENVRIRKYFRDPDKKVLGGVAAGVAAYTGWDVAVIRFVWVISILFFGTGLMLYLILWAITPVAQTLTDRMQMQGEPITLSNIETNIKRTLNVDRQPVENTTTKILLFPFRLVAAVFTALSPLLRNIPNVLRVVLGFAMLLFGIVGFLAATGAYGGSLGLASFNTAWVRENALHLPPVAVLQEASPWMLFFVYLLAAVPLLATAMLGLTLMRGHRSFRPLTWQVLLGLFLVGLVGSSVMVPRFAMQFAGRDRAEKTLTFNLPGTPTFDMTNATNTYRNTTLELEGYTGTELRLIQEFESRGSSNADARRRAAALAYTVSQQDSVLRFPEQMELAGNAGFRGQELRMRLQVPYGRPFAMSEDFARYVSNRFPNRFFEENAFEGALFKFLPDSGLICLNRNIPMDDEDGTFGESDSDDVAELTSRIGLGTPYEHNLKDFENVEIRGGMPVEIRRGDTFKVVVYARGSRRDLNIRVDGNTLRIDNGRNIWQNFRNRDNNLSIRITMPVLHNVEMSGAVAGIIRGFSEVRHVDAIGASNVTVQGLAADDLDVEATGAARVTLLGTARRLNADLTGASQLRAFSLQAQEVQVDAIGACQADVYGSTRLDLTASGASRIRYGGNGSLKSSSSGGSSIDRDQEHRGENAEEEEGRFVEPPAPPMPKSL